MTLLFEYFWLWFVVLFALGALTALFVDEREPPGRLSPWLIWSALAFVAGLAAASLHVFSGRHAIWLHSGLIGFAAYLLGGALGVGAKQGSLREHRGWALGLAPAILLWLLGVDIATPALEHDLADKSAAIAREDGEDSTHLAVHGRDVFASGLTKDAEALKRKFIAAGADRVQFADAAAAQKPQDASAESPPSKEAKAKADQAAPNIAAQTPKPDAEHRAATAPERAGAPSQPGGSSLAASETAAAPAPRLTQEEAQAALAALPASGSLDVAACRAAIQATTAIEKIGFRPGRATIHVPAAYALDRVASLLKRCPQARAEIAAYGDAAAQTRGDIALSQRRADAAMRYLMREGVAAQRLSATGRGSWRLGDASDDTQGRARQGAVEFAIR